MTVKELIEELQMLDPGLSTKFYDTWWEEEQLENGQWREYEAGIERDINMLYLSDDKRSVIMTEIYLKQVMESYNVEITRAAKNKR